MYITDYEKMILNDLSKRIIDIDPFGARDADETPETIAKKLVDDPLTVIEYLVETIEDLQA